MTQFTAILVEPKVLQRKPKSVAGVSLIFVGRWPMERDNSGERRRHPRKQVALQAEFHFEERASPIRGQISDVSAGGCFVETMFTKPVGLKLDVVLWLGEAKIGVRCVIATCTPLVGNGIEFREMTPADRDRLTKFLETLQ